MRYAIAIAALLLSTAAQAHSWYPWNCCQEYDCAPAESVVIVSPDVMAITTEHGVIYVPSSMERKESPDNKVHACAVPDYRDGKKFLRPVCVFFPAGN